jgi:hypothetical protein
MDSATQQNAALVEQSVAASRMLEQQAGELKRQVAFFQLNRQDAADGNSPSSSQQYLAGP